MAGRITIAGIALAVLAVTCAGCTAVNSGAPVTLRIGTDDGPGVPAADQISNLTTVLEDSSLVTLEPVWHAAGHTNDWDQAIAELVIDGDLDLAVVPSRAWASLGVTTLEPLTTPFLIQSDEALHAVLDDDELMDRMLAGLGEVGLVGIAAMPESLRRPFGYQGPLVEPRDYAGGVVRTATAEVNESLYRAFGATVTDDEPDVDTQLGTDSSYLLNPFGTATGNVVFYPKINVLVANADAWSALDEGARQAIQTAAQDTREWVEANQPKDAAAARAWCADGGTIVAATPEQVDAFEKAAQPVVEQIAGMGDNAAIIAAIESVIARVDPPQPTTSCGEASPVPVSDASIAGTYRWQITEDSLAAAGFSQAYCCGIITWTFDPDGTWLMRSSDLDGSDVTTVHGTWKFDGALLSIHDPDYIDYVLAVMIAPNGDITASPHSGPLQEIDLAALTSTQWLKIE